MLGVELDVGVLKFGALVWGRAWGRLSGTPNEMMSTMLETSLEIFSGKADGNSLPTSFRLHKYMATANSGNRSCPDLVVSDNVLSPLINGKLVSANTLPYPHQVGSRKFRSNKQVLDLLPCDWSAHITSIRYSWAPTIQSLPISDCRLEELFEFGLICSCQERQTDLRYFGAGRRWATR